MMATPSGVEEESTSSAARCTSGLRAHRDDRTSLVATCAASTVP
jgi:hypothetical protein